MHLMQLGQLLMRQNNQHFLHRLPLPLYSFFSAAGQGLGWEGDAVIARVYAKNAGISLP